MGDIKIVADYREKPSGIPDLLRIKGAEVELRQLNNSGDYFINNKITVERETAEDFIQSLVSNRLFIQCQRIKAFSEYPLLIIEGNPFRTRHKINTKAVKGAILSVSAAWQIPVYITADSEETAEILLIAGKQMVMAKVPVVRSGIKPKRRDSRKLWFIQGLPAVGPVLALRLLERFKPVKRIINLSKEELLQIEGIGTKKARQIMEFIRN